MRRLHFDEYEFDSPDSEEELDVVIGSTEHFEDFAAFALEAGIPSGRQQQRKRLSELSDCGRVLDYLHRLAGFELPRGGSVPALVFSEEWDDLDLAMLVGRHFIWYHWRTTA